jgi:hypothetical protein
MDAALHADFRRAAAPRLAYAAGDLAQIDVVGLAAQMLVRLAL